MYVLFKNIQQKIMEDKKVWILVTGGLGYIGSHICVQLCLQGYNVIIVDNGYDRHNVFENMNKIIEDSVVPTATPKGELKLKYCDLAKEDLWIPKKCDCIIHLATTESIKDPLLYYETILGCLFTVLRCAKQWGNAPAFIFSSSAEVYCQPSTLPVSERHPLKPLNPYGQSKEMCETIIRETYESSAGIGSAIVLRYINPIGAHPSGLIGPKKSSNLMSVICQTVSNEQSFLTTHSQDGSHIRDLNVHVMDIANAHVAAIRRSLIVRREYVELNLESGKGYTVQEGTGGDIC
jgi:UDP-glucose 4-epimerase